MEQDSSSKRQRINQACDQCRKRKSKCDGEQPGCATCRGLGKACTYGTPVKKRGLPTGYVRGVEALLGLFQQSLPNGEYKLRRLLRDNLVGRTVDSDYLEQASDIWRSSSLAKDLDQLLSLADDAATPRSSSGVDRILKLPALESISPIIAHREPDTADDAFTRLEQCLDVVPPNLPDNIQEIVDHYFQTTHCWFPILERRTILRALYHDDSYDATECEHEGHRLCLWAIVAYTSATSGRAAHNSLSWVTSDSVQAYIRLCLSRREQAFSIGNAQALAILALLNIGMRRLSTSRLLLSQAFCMLIDADSSDRHRSERYFHTMQGCFFLDQLLSTHMSKYPLFFNKQLSIMSELDENALDEWELWIPPHSSGSSSTGYGKQPLRTISSFNLIIQIARKLPSLHADSYSIDRLRDSIDDLGNWYSKLKRHHQLPVSGAASPPILVLHLTYKFGLLAFLEMAYDAGMQCMPLIEETLSWMVQVLSQCLEVGHILFGNPLLVVFSLQIKSCMDRFQIPESSEMNQSVWIRCFRFLERFQKQHKFMRSETAARNDATVPSVRLTNATELRSQNSSISPIINVRGMTIPVDANATTLQQTSVNNGNFLVADAPADRVVSDKDDFDVIFEDMASMVLPRRYDCETADFAQNLGFLTSDLDFNSLAFHRTQPGV